MKNNFDLKKFLAENKLTENSRLLKEYVEVKSPEELAKQLEKELGVNGRITYKVEGEPLSGLPKKFDWAINHMLKNDNNPELDTFCKHAFDWLKWNKYTVKTSGGSFGSDASINASHESGNGSESVVVSIYRAKMSEGELDVPEKETPAVKNIDKDLADRGSDFKSINTKDKLGKLLDVIVNQLDPKFRESSAFKMGVREFFAKHR